MFQEKRFSDVSLKLQNKTENNFVSIARRTHEQNFRGK